MAKITKGKAKTTGTTKKPAAAKPAPAAAKKTATAVKVTVKGKTTMKVAPPVQKAKPAPQVQKAAPAPVAAAPVAAPVAKKPEKLDFTTGDFVVYPAHGVGYVEGVETTTIAGMEITLYTICFEKDRMRLKLPVSKVKSSGLRKLSSKDRLKDALATLQGRSQTRRVMWSRRAQEYEAKINSGDPVAIAEVLRDLRKDTDESEQSYSERQIYQAALERLAREVAAIEKIDEKKAAEKLEAVLSNVA
jgi:CarD family transcriptional regulator